MNPPARFCVVLFAIVHDGGSNARSSDPYAEATGRGVHAELDELHGVLLRRVDLVARPRRVAMTVVLPFVGPPDVNDSVWK